MKTRLWAVAVLVVAAAAFALAFGVTFLHRGSHSPTKAGEYAPLSFPHPKYRPGGAPAVCELGKSGACDFWFVNPNDKDVTVGLERITCKCSSVRLQCVAAGPLASFLAARVGFAATEPGGGVLTPVAPMLTEAALAAWQDEWAAGQFGGPEEGTELTEKGSTVVPPRAVGAVHLVWKTEELGNRQVVARLWTAEPANVTNELDALSKIVPALQITPNLTVADLGTLTSEDLPRTVELYCFSQTRSWLPLTAHAPVVGLSGPKDPVKVGAVVPLGQQERQALQDKVGLRLRSAYKVAVTLLPVSLDGTTPFDVGVFQRFVEFRCAEQGIDPVEAEVRAFLRGVVTVGDTERAGFINFGLFPAAEGKKRQVLVESDVAGLQLDVDAKRVPPFLAVPQLSEPDVTPGGHRTWRLTVEVPPGKALGHFPNAEDPAYRDSAVYLKTREKPSRPIRIPVKGTANAG
jgi:hypothetical protein